MPCTVPDASSWRCPVGSALLAHRHSPKPSPHSRFETAHRLMALDITLPTAVDGTPSSTCRSQGN